MLGFLNPVNQSESRADFSVVSYVLNGQVASAILLIQNIGTRLANETLLLYNIGLSEEETRKLNTHCNSSKCSVIFYDLSRFPVYVSDEHMHAFRPIIIKDALNRCKSILFVENRIRIRSSTNDLRTHLVKTANESGVLGWTTRQPVSSRTHPRMFDYFQTDAENFEFLPMVAMDVVFFIDSKLTREKIVLPWIKCTLTLECIRPIGTFLVFSSFENRLNN